MKVPFCAVIIKHRALHSYSVYPELSDIICPGILKCPDDPVYGRSYKQAVSLCHDDKMIPKFIHIADICFAKVSPVQNKPNIFIAVCLRFVQRILQLRYVYNTPRIVLIKQRFPVCTVVCYGAVKYGLIRLIFRFPKLNHINISGLAVLVRCIVGDINLFTVISACVPFIQEINCRIITYVVQKTGYFAVAVYVHTRRKQRVVIGIHRIVLSGVVFCKNRISRQIQKQSGIPSQIRRKHFFEMIILNHFLNDHEASALKTLASVLC